MLKQNDYIQKSKIFEIVLKIKCHIRIEETLDGSTVYNIDRFLFTCGFFCNFPYII